MTKEQFLKLNVEMGQLPPDLDIQKEYMEKKFQDFGLSKENGYKSVQYYYSELFKAKEGLETIFPGKVIIDPNHFGIVDSATAYFQMTYERFNKRIELYFPKISTEQPKQFVSQIDFNQSSSDYFNKKLSELLSLYKEKKIVDKEFLEIEDTSVNPPKIGDIVSITPDWSKNPVEAFEQFKNFYAYKMFLVEIINFLKTIGSWNQRAIEDKLKEQNQFIDEAEKEINFNESARKESNLRNDKQKYILLAHDYYLTHSIEKDCNYQLEIMYARYFLFRELLKQKSTIENQQVKKQSNLNVTDLVYSISLFV